MPKLTDTQLVILSAAAKRDDRVVLPLPKTLRINQGSAASVLKSLLTRRLITERPAAVDEPAWREGKNDGRLTLVIADAGLKAIGIEPDASGTGKSRSSKRKSTRTSGSDRRSPPTKGRSKTDTILALLRRSEGASIADLQKATRWQPHSVRALLTGLRKRGIAVTRSKDDPGPSIYRVVPGPVDAR